MDELRENAGRTIIQSLKVSNAEFVLQAEPTRRDLLHDMVTKVFYILWNRRDWTRKGKATMI